MFIYTESPWCRRPIVARDQLSTIAEWCDHMGALLDEQYTLGNITPEQHAQLSEQALGLALKLESGDSLNGWGTIEAEDRVMRTLATMEAAANATA